MDHRCLYGHRVPAEFTFAIEQRLCPRCGSGTVSVAGYQVARKLTAGVPMDGVDAFKVVRFLEQEYTLTPRATPEAQPDLSMAEIEIEEAEVEATAAEEKPAPAPVEAAPEPKPRSRAVKVTQVKGTEAPAVAPAMPPADDDAPPTEDSESELERSFFT